MGELTVAVEDAGAKGAFIAMSGGAELGRMTYSRAGTSRIIVDHTEVDPAAKGQGVGQALFDRMVLWARENAVKVIPLCPYAASRFARQPEAADVLDAA